ncbi:DUF4142 domain-containing protein [Phenylobacterium sp.]|jgi:putative membrane protein|uniref:DUF4142 domain-containing protein n=1 Tax=Phenylobacterium sp. TaxID=1871053 RepID=UPI002F92C5EC
MQTFFKATAMAGLLALSACASGMDSGGMAQPAAAAPTTMGAYLAEAARADMYEIQAGELAQSKGSAAGVRQFGAMMVRDHTTTTQQLMQAVMSSGASPPPPPPLDARRAGLLRALRGASGAGFDRLYAQQQLMAHQEALALHQGYAQGGDNAALRATAAQIVPAVQQHLQHVQHMAGGGGSGG